MPKNKHKWQFIVSVINAFVIANKVKQSHQGLLRRIAPRNDR
jgi:hypothetical protein